MSILRCNRNLERVALQWRHNDHDGVSNYQPHSCLLNRFFGRRSKKTPKLRVTGLWAGNSPGPVNSPHKWPVTRKMFPLDDVIMELVNFCFSKYHITSFSRYGGVLLVCVRPTLSSVSLFLCSYSSHNTILYLGDIEEWFHLDFFIHHQSLSPVK